MGILEIINIILGIALHGTVTIGWFAYKSIKELYEECVYGSVRYNILLILMAAPTIPIPKSLIISLSPNYLINLLLF